MGVNCIILSETDKDYVQGGPCEANSSTSYGNGSQLRPVQRQGGTSGNPDPCFILNVLVLSNPDFASAQAYLSGLPVKNSSDPGFPPEIPSDDE
ncbi:hypothetical protein BH10PSE6_BH10PSE6_16810 [soil metagenome]